MLTVFSDWRIIVFDFFTNVYGFLNMTDKKTSTNKNEKHQGITWLEMWAPHIAYKTYTFINFIIMVQVDILARRL